MLRPASLVYARSRRQVRSRSTLLGVQVEDRADRAPTDGAERHLVAREHDAIHLRPVESARLVVGAFEHADLAGVRTRVQQRGVVLLLFSKERVHLALGTIRRANRATTLLNLLRVALESFFRPRCRHRRPWF